MNLLSVISSKIPIASGLLCSLIQTPSASRNCFQPFYSFLHGINKVAMKLLSVILAKKFHCFRFVAFNYTNTKYKQKMFLIFIWTFACLIMSSPFCQAWSGLYDYQFTINIVCRGVSSPLLVIPPFTKRCDPLIFSQISNWHLNPLHKRKI